VAHDKLCEAVEEGELRHGGWIKSSEEFDVCHTAQVNL